MKTALREILYAHALTSASLTSSNTYWGKAPQGLTGDFCVISLVTNPVNRVTDNGYSEEFIQLSFYAEALGDAEDLQEEVEAIFEDISTLRTSLTAGGFTLSGIYLINREHLQYENYHQLTSRYMVEVYE